MKELEIGEKVDLDSGINIRRESEEVFFITQAKTNSSMRIRKEDIRNVARLAGFIGQEMADIDPW